MSASKLSDEQGYPKRREGDQTTHQIALARCEELIERYLGWKKENHTKSDRAQVAALILTAITPVLLLIPAEDMVGYVKIIAAATSAGAAVATGLLAVYGWRENYIRYGYTWHALQSEKYRYLTHATQDYQDKDEEEAAETFAKRVEELVMAEVNDWRSEMQRIEQQIRKGGTTNQETAGSNGT